MAWAFRSRARKKPARESFLLGGTFSETYPIFELEALFIHYCRALRDRDTAVAKDLSAEIESHPLSQEKEIYFGKLARILNGKKVKLPGHLVPFADHLLSAFSQKETGKQALTVDLTLFLVSVPQEKKPICSRPMALAFDLLRMGRGASLEDFCRTCFGLSRFDPTIHMPRVYNLLWRLNSLKHSGLKFRVRDGIVYSEGDWRRVSFVRDGLLSKQLSAQPEWATLITESSARHEPSEPSISKKSSLYWEGFLKRAEVEKLLARPRSTTNRILKRLVTQGVVIREGGARHARYRLKQLSEINLEKLV